MAIDIKRTIQRANLAGRIPARAFRLDGVGAYTVEVPGSTGMIYAQTKWGPPFAVRNTNALTSPADDGIAIWVAQDTDGTWRTDGRRFEG